MTHPDEIISSLTTSKRLVVILAVAIITLVIGCRKRTTRLISFSAALGEISRLPVRSDYLKKPPVAHVKAMHRRPKWQDEITLKYEDYGLVKRVAPSPSGFISVSTGMIGACSRKAGIGYLIPIEGGRTFTLRFSERGLKVNRKTYALDITKYTNAATARSFIGSSDIKVLSLRYLDSSRIDIKLLQFLATLRPYLSISLYAKDLSVSEIAKLSVVSDKIISLNLVGASLTAKLSAVLEKLEWLRYLRIDGASRIETGALRFVKKLRHLSHMELLDLRDVGRVPFDAISSSVTVRSISAYDTCFAVNPSGGGTDTSSPLRYIRLQSICRKADDTKLLARLFAMSRLEYLHFPSDIKITSAIVSKLNSLHRLKYVDLGYNHSHSKSEVMLQLKIRSLRRVSVSGEVLDRHLAELVCTKSSLVEVDASNMRLTKLLLLTSCLKANSSLRRIHVSMKVSPSDGNESWSKILPKLGRLRKLTRLAITGAGIPRAAMRYMPPSTNLRRLIVEASTIEGADFSPSGSFSNVESVTVIGGVVTDKSVRVLSRSNAIKSLYIESARLKCNGITLISRIGSLRWLYFGRLDSTSCRYVLFPSSDLRFVSIRRLNLAPNGVLDLSKASSLMRFEIQSGINGNTLSALLNNPNIRLVNIGHLQGACPATITMPPKTQLLKLCIDDRYCCKVLKRAMSQTNSDATLVYCGG